MADQTIEQFLPHLLTGDISDKTQLYLLLSNLQGVPATQGMTWDQFEAAFDLATSSTQGLMSGGDKSKLDDFVSVIDFGADPTGVSDSGSAIQSAVDFAATNFIGTVYFPKGTYLINTQVNLPKDATGENRRLTLDFGNSTITTSSNVVLFNRTISSLSESLPVRWMYTIQNGTFIQTGVRNGTVFRLHQTANLDINNIFVRNMTTAIELVFALEHNVTNVNTEICLNPFVVRGGDGIFIDGDPINSNSNVGVWTNCRAQLNDAAAVGFDFNNSSGITLINPVCEGSNGGVAWRFGGKQGTTPSRYNTYTVINGWVEFNVGSTLSKVVDLVGIDLGFVDLQIYGIAIPGPPIFTAVDADTIRTKIRWHDTILFNSNRGAGLVWFDAGTLPAPNQINWWVFDGCSIAEASNTFSDSQRWAAGVVPTEIRETQLNFGSGSIYDSYLTAFPNSILMNSGSSDAIVKPVTTGGLPTQPSAAGSRFLGWDAAGDLAEFDPGAINAVSRKSGIDDLGTLGTGTLTIDWDAGNADQKQVELTADVTLAAFTATRSGAYQLHVLMDGTGFHSLALTGVNLQPAIFNVPLVYTPGGLAVIKFDYNASTGVWTW